MKKISLIEKAARIALEAHSRQKRKDDGSPYIIHPFMVALKLVKNGFSDETVAAALVHDVLEDTKVSEETLQKELGNSVLNIIKVVTEDKSLPWEEIKYIIPKEFYLLMSLGVRKYGNTTVETKIQRCGSKKNV